MRLFKGPIVLVGGLLALQGAFAIDVDPENEGLSITRRSEGPVANIALRG